MQTTRPAHILLIEDDDIDAESVARAFEKHKIGNPLSRARDGVEALEILRNENGKNPLPEPRLLLLDLNMPRMDGIELLEEIRKDDRLKRTLVFVLTTSKSEEDKFKAYNFNVAGYLIKSQVGEDFINMINMLNHYWKIVEFPTENN